MKNMKRICVKENNNIKKRSLVMPKKQRNRLHNSKNDLKAKDGTIKKMRQEEELARN